MSDHRQENAVRGAAMAPLTTDQRKRLAILAHNTFNQLCRQGRIPDGTDFDAWRHHQAMMAVERPGLTACRQEDFLPLQAHFLGLMGADKLADHARLRAATEPRRQALAVLWQECRKAEAVIERPRDYIARIARCRFKGVAIEDLAEKQIWGLVFDIRRNVQRRLRK
ncbi:MAG: hypothetical protein ACOYOU_00930 [Kiritimatiellia bacterium]